MPRWRGCASPCGHPSYQMSGHAGGDDCESALLRDDAFLTVEQPATSSSLETGVGISVKKRYQYFEVKVQLSRSRNRRSAAMLRRLLTRRRRHVKQERLGNTPLIPDSAPAAASDGNRNLSEPISLRTALKDKGTEGCSNGRCEVCSY